MTHPPETVSTTGTSRERRRRTAYWVALIVGLLLLGLLVVWLMWAYGGDRAKPTDQPPIPTPEELQEDEPLDGAIVE